MAQKQTVDPANIKTLRDWVGRWPKAGNLGFDEETREPAIYSRDAARRRLQMIPWRREGDTITILTQPQKFASTAVDAARRRYDVFRTGQQQIAAAAAQQLVSAEQKLLDTWRAYEDAPAAAKPMMRRSVLVAEKAVRELEATMGAQMNPERGLQRLDKGAIVYNPPIPIMQRGIPLTEIAGGAAAAAPGSE
jgi:hypothetical protein